MKLNDPLTKLIFSLIVWLKLYYQKIINIINFFFSEKISWTLYLMVTMHGYHLALIKVSILPPPPHLPIPVQMITWLAWYIKVPVKCTWLVYKIHNVKSNEQTFLLSKEGFYLFFTKTFQKRFLINWHEYLYSVF